METKIYIVSCEDKKVFDLFTSTIGYKIFRVKIIDSIERNIKELNKLGNKSLSVYNTKDVDLSNKLVSILNDYNDCVFKSLIKTIDEHSTDNILYTFVRVNDLKTINKLKRYYKRPNYKTIRLNNTVELNNKNKLLYKNYRFDNRIEYVNNLHFKNQIKLFMRMRINSIEFMNLNF